MSISPASPDGIRVLVLEDEPDLQEAIVTFLNMEGFIADGVGSLRAAEHWMRTHPFDILILDLGLPDGDGLSWLMTRTDLPEKGVIITSARSEGMDRITGAKAGADVYLTKPIQLEELTLMVKNLSRRIRSKAEQAWTLSKMKWMLLSPEGAMIKLTRSEMVLLANFAATPGEVISRATIIKSLGQNPDDYDPRRMEVLVRRLRVKTKETLGFELPLETVHKQGFVFTASLRLQ
jgi:DNA-binding response OmpR family regulator